MVRGDYSRLFRGAISGGFWPTQSEHLMDCMDVLKELIVGEPNFFVLTNTVSDLSIINYLTNAFD